MAIPWERYLGPHPPRGPGAFAPHRSDAPSHHEHLAEASVHPTIAGDPGVSDVPTWRIGDRWIYSGTFDPSVLVTDTGVDATVGEIQGDTTAEVTGITTQNVDNMSVLAYTLRTSANFDKSGVSLEGFTGNVYIQFTQTEYLRVSDLSPIRVGHVHPLRSQRHFVP